MGIKTLIKLTVHLPSPSLSSSFEIKSSIIHIRKTTENLLKVAGISNRSYTTKQFIFGCLSWLIFSFFTFSAFGTNPINPAANLGEIKSSESAEVLTNSFAPEICDNGIDDDGDGLIDCADPDCSAGLTFERWLGISGNSITDLTSDSDFPDNPSETGTLSSFDGPNNYADNYGTRVRGFVIPTESGTYSFNITSDDDSELYLSTDASSNNMMLIASVSGYTNVTQHTKYSSQTSSNINLVSGQYYYVEMFQKEGGGDDHFQVYWKTPSNSSWTIIPNSNLQNLGCYEICGNGIDDDGDGLIDNADDDCSGTYFEAECATIGLNWNTVTDGTASNNEYVTIQNGLSSMNSAPSGVNDRITFTFDVSVSGHYKVFGRVNAPSSDDDSFWVRANGGTWYKWNSLSNSDWTWTRVYDWDNSGSIIFFPLTAGSNTIDIAYREDGALLDKIFVTLNGSTPSGTGEAASNCFVPEICDNSIDDDGDGLIDCADDECTASIAGAISGDENFCDTYTPAEITSMSAGAAGANSSLQYQWQQTTDTSGIWADLGAADTLETFQPPAISQTTFYRRKASTLHCADGLFTNAVSKAVDINVTNAGTIGYDESVTGPFDPAAIVQVTAPSGGSGSVEYVWYSSTGGTWNLIPGATSSSYDPAAISQSTWYRRASRTVGCTGNPNCCGSTWIRSNIVLKEVIPPLTGGGVIGLIAPHPPENGQGNVLEEKSSPIGLLEKRATYQWEYSDNGNEWKELYGASTSDLQASRFEKHNYFRRKVRNANHLPWEYSNIVDGNAIAPAISQCESDNTEKKLRTDHSLITCNISSNIKLEGAKGKGPLMRDDLREKGLLPSFSPYANQGSLRSERVTGEVFQKTGEKAVVDWVNLELYTSLSNADPDYVQPALLLRDGNICGLDGQSPVTIAGFLGKKYHLLIRHRNHESVASKKYKFKTGNVISITEFYSVEMGKLGQKTDVMASAIHRAENSIIPGNGMVEGYEFYDFNMDGVAIPSGPGNENFQFLKYAHLNGRPNSK